MEIAEPTIRIWQPSPVTARPLLKVFTVFAFYIRPQRTLHLLAEEEREVSKFKRIS